MRKSDKVERYLRQLERELGQMPDEPRARVLAEVRAQIKKGLAEGRSTAAVLREVGSPKLIAMSHMKLRPAASEPRSPWLRGAAFATVIFFGLIFAYGLYWIRENPNRRRKVTAAADPGTATQMQTDARNLREFAVTTLVIPFETGRLTLRPAVGESLTWECAGVPRVEVLGSVLTLNLDKFDVARCDLAVPLGVRVQIHGTNGHLDILKPRNPLDIKLVNGRVSLKADPTKSYDYDVHVKNGLQEFFKPSNKPGAIKIKIAVTNGTVKKE